MLVVEDDLSGPGTQALLRIHLQGMHASSPPGHVFALDLSGLKDSRVTVWSVRERDSVLGIGALRQIDAANGELKSMRTAPNHLRRGVGSLLLEHIIGVARARGYRRLSLETGTGAAFEPALALYRNRGFAEGEPFGDYVRSDFSRFLHLQL